VVLENAACNQMASICLQRGGEEDKQRNLTAIIQSRHLSIFGHIARMDDDADAKMILMAPPTENWKRPPWLISRG